MVQKFPGKRSFQKFRKLLACEQQTHFRSSRFSPSEKYIFRRERSDDRKCVCCSQARKLFTDFRNALLHFRENCL